jgi:hypothetical protein
MKVSTENNNNFGYEEITILVGIFQMEQMQDICKGSGGPLERTQGSATRPTRAEVAKILFDR